MSTPTRVSIRQVAQHAGVSRMTVSNVMHGRVGSVAPETMERVLAAVRELEYLPVPQPTTQSRQVETHIIGLIFDSINVEDLWGLPTYRGMREVARERGYDLLTLLRSPADWMLDSQELHFLDRRSDGLVFAVPQDRTPVFKALVTHGIPVVSCFVDDVPQGVATIVLDNAGAMKGATEYLIAHGHQKILHVAGPKNRADFRARRQSYEVTMQAAGLVPQVVQLQDLEDGSWLLEIEKFLRSQAVSAIGCASDGFALAILDLAQKLDLAVPHDFSLIAMDDVPDAALRGLTTFHFSCEEVGRQAVNAIVNMIGGATADSCSRILPVEIVERNSVAQFTG